MTQLDASMVCGCRLAVWYRGCHSCLNSSGWDVHASIAVNSLNHIAMLLHVQKLWTRCAHFVFNIYHGWPALVMRGMADFIMSKERVTLGDPLSMYVYAIGILALV